MGLQSHEQILVAQINRRLQEKSFMPDMLMSQLIL